MEQTREKAQKIRLLILDIDGVMTDGTLYVGPQGCEYKGFNIKDGQGIRLLMNAGIEVAVITGRKSDSVSQRMSDLKIEHVYQGTETKLNAFNELINKLELSPDQVAYIGDDILDIPVMQTVGLPVCVADAHSMAVENADWQTQAAGGQGAVREVCDFILDSQNLLEKTISKLFQSS